MEILKQLIPSLIPVFVPLMIAGLKSLLPKIPGKWLPILAPILGGLADAVSGAVGLGSFGPIWGAALGAAGVGVREVVDQWRGKPA